MADSSQPLAKKPEWQPRFWEGANFSTWFRHLWVNRFAVHWSLWYIVVIATILTLTNSVLRGIQWLFYGRAIRRAELQGPPIFIIGHWRTGTTFLHELMIQDPRFGFPNTYQCVAPNHFLLTETVLSKLLWFLMPKERPMDRMKLGFDRPQEDEFALCLLGARSPYSAIAFPNRPPMDAEYLDFDGVPPERIERWKGILLWFLKAVTLRQKKRLVLKSPPHTARIKTLNELFPEAIFINIIRDPYVVFPSTMNLWRSLYKAHGLQKPNCEGLEDRVFSTFLRMHERLEEGKKLIAPGRYFEMRYEDLVKNPHETVRAVYEHFQLGEWETMRSRLDAYLATVKNYETNKYQLAPEQRAMIAARWGEVMRRQGYAVE